MRDKMTQFAVLLLLYFAVRTSTGELYGSVNIPKGGRTSGVSPSAQKADHHGRITEQDVEEALSKCQKILEDREALVAKLYKKGKYIKPSERKADLSLLDYKNFNRESHSKESCQLPLEEASKLLYEKYNLKSTDNDNRLASASLSGELGSVAKDFCDKNVTADECDRNSRYRTANGQCNNPCDTLWGSVMTCQQRLLPPHYSGNNEFRRSVSGHPLPNPRTLSLNLHHHLNQPNDKVTHMHMFFGQLLDHDLTLTPISRTMNDSAIECCPIEEEMHPQCVPIELSNRDPFYSQFNITCMNFVRSASCPTCSLGSREQMNQITAFIDASFVYGNNQTETDDLRTLDGRGHLRTECSRFGELLPPSPDPDSDGCSFPDTNEICFQAGDPRTNQHIVLAALHTIFVREHNRLATELRQINRHWDEETLFQETRRILGAITQVIVYKEYLPMTLGNDWMSYFDLWINAHDQTRYDPRINPNIFNEFSTAAFRFGHSQIHSVMQKQFRDGATGQRLLRNEFFEPFDLRKGLTGPFLKGTSNSSSQWVDRHLVEDVTNFLYRVRGNATGLDLAAININRGRDHGLPPYTVMLEFCSDGHIVVRDFDDLTRYGLMLMEEAKVLKRNYRYVEDIDLWTGIVMEIPSIGAVVGPTAACILGRQFHNLKFGDRFYFEHGDEKGSFTKKQLRELKRVRLSHIFCLNSDAHEVPRNAMLFSSRDNPVIHCDHVRGMDLHPWKEHRS